MIAPTKGKEMDACDITSGVSFIKEGDSTPVTAADFAIQARIGLSFVPSLLSSDRCRCRYPSACRIRSMHLGSGAGSARDLARERAEGSMHDLCCGSRQGSAADPARVSLLLS